MKSRSYTIEFKKQAVELAETLGSASKAGEQLGISPVNIHVWKKKLSPVPAATKPQKEQELEEELRKIRQENAELKKVNYILKAAAAFFSQDHLK